MTAPAVLDQALIERVLQEARASARLRKNHNFHSSAPHGPEEKAGFAPEEGAPGVPEYLARLARLFDGA